MLSKYVKKKKNPFFLWYYLFKNNNKNDDLITRTTSLAMGQGAKGPCPHLPFPPLLKKVTHDSLSFR